MAVLVDAAGIVFFVLFLNSQGTIKKLKKQRAVVASDMQYMRNAQALSGTTPTDIQGKETFISKLDGVEDNYVYTPPAIKGPQGDSILFVYFHGMGSTSLEPYLVPKDRTLAKLVCQQNPRASFLSPNYRGDSSWLNETAILDVDQNIRSVINRYPASKIVLIGTSMGGCAALAYSYLAPAEIKSKIVGVVSCESSGDLTELYKVTNSNLVKAGMARAYGGSPDTVGKSYEKTSILKNISQLNPKVKYAILSASKDGVVPPKMQTQLLDGLQKAGIKCKLIDFDEKHGVPESTNYEHGINFVLEAN